MHRKYFSISTDDPLWTKLSRKLRGKNFRVPCSWRKGIFLSFNDWCLLVNRKLAGKVVYVHKIKKINYRQIPKYFT
ncbi:MAG: hypothetical protein QMD71_09410 [bacterium]|nr:hypothetical protein [bacterium]